MLGGGGVRNPFNSTSSASRLRSVVAGDTDTLKRLFIDDGLQGEAAQHLAHITLAGMKLTSHSDSRQKLAASVTATLLQAV